MPKNNDKKQACNATTKKCACETRQYKIQTLASHPLSTPDLAACVNIFSIRAQCAFQPGYGLTGLICFYPSQSQLKIAKLCRLSRYALCHSDYEYGRRDHEGRDRAFLDTKYA